MQNNIIIQVLAHLKVEHIIQSYKTIFLTMLFKSQITFFKCIFMGMSVMPAYMYVHLSHAVPTYNRNSLGCDYQSLIIS